MASRKFAGLRAEIEKAKDQGGADAQSETGRSNGRRPGKRSNPAWTQHTVMLEKATHRAAVAILLHQDDGMDVSDLLNSLLADWVRQHQTKT
jgi:hypothetical protein